MLSRVLLRDIYRMFVLDMLIYHSEIEGLKIFGPWECRDLEFERIGGDMFG
jgi:hypothetical protein